MFPANQIHILITVYLYNQDVFSEYHVKRILILAHHLPSTTCLHVFF